MKKREAVDYLKGRWETVHKIEVEELKKTPLKDRFSQTMAMFDLGKYLITTKRADAEINTIRARWRQLKDCHHASK